MQTNRSSTFNSSAFIESVLDRGRQKVQQENKRKQVRSLFRAFRRDRSGATAIEFAIVAMPFLAVVFAIIEFGLAFFINRVLDNSVADATRLIKTGQAQKQGLNEAEFKTAICQQLTTALCNESRLEVDVRVFNSFSQIALPDLVDADGNTTGRSSYATGNGGQIVVARVIYRWPMFTSLLQTNAGDTGNMERLLFSTAVFRNEPFPWSAPAPCSSPCAKP